MLHQGLYDTKDPMSAALKRFSAAEERVGNFKVQLDSEVTQKFHVPFTTTLNQAIGHAMVKTVNKPWMFDWF